MKTVAIIVLIVVAEIALMCWLSGCGAVPTVKAARAALPPMPKVVQSPISFAEPETVLPPPPVTNTVLLHFTYSQCPLTNGYVQSSTDLIQWQTRQDFAVTTNGDGSVDWTLPNDGQPQEYFRAGGCTIPGVTTNL